MDRGVLAATAARILADMERNDEVFMIAYQDGQLVIVPRIKEKYGDGNPDGWTGSCVAFHAFEAPPSEQLRRVNGYIPRNRDFGWERYVVRLPVSRKITSHLLE